MKSLHHFAQYPFRAFGLKSLKVGIFHGIYTPNVRGNRCAAVFPRIQLTPMIAAFAITSFLQLTYRCRIGLAIFSSHAPTTFQAHPCHSSIP